MDQYSAILFQLDANGCAEISLNRPEARNALSPLLIKELTHAIKRCEIDPKVRIIKVTGQGKIFCAGADLNHMQAIAHQTYEQNLEDARELGHLFATVNGCSKPTMAIIQGGAYGGGVGLVAVCDIAIATQDAKFSLSEVRLGIIPAVISPYLVRAMGVRQALRYALTAQVITAQEALQHGLIHYQVMESDLQALVDQITSYLSQGSPAAQAATKKLFHTVEASSLSAELNQITAAAIAEARASLDGQEGLKAFLEKRQPSWI